MLQCRCGSHCQVIVIATSAVLPCKETQCMNRCAKVHTVSDQVCKSLMLFEMQPRGLTEFDAARLQCKVPLAPWW